MAKRKAVAEFPSPIAPVESEAAKPAEVKRRGRPVGSKTRRVSQDVGEVISDVQIMGYRVLVPAGEEHAKWHADTVRRVYEESGMPVPKEYANTAN